MAELMEFTNGILFWDVSFFRGFHVQELEVVSSFMDIKHGSLVRRFGEDIMSWKPDKNKWLMVNAYYSLLVGSNFFVSLGKVFGSRRSLFEWLSLSGLLPWENA